MIFETSRCHHMPCIVCGGLGYLETEIYGVCLKSKVHIDCPNCIDGIAYANEFEMSYDDARQYAGSGWWLSHWDKKGTKGDKLYERIRKSN